MVEPTDGVHAMPVNDGWDSLPWFTLEQDLFRLQKRIYRASQRGDFSTLRRLQKLLLTSQAAKLIAVRRITQDNMGKKTAGSMGSSSSPRSNAWRWPTLSGWTGRRLPCGVST